MTDRFLNQRTDVYEAMIDWPKRLDHEGPFYRALFEQAEAKSVIDSACGTGHHAAMFHLWGIDVEAADHSREMISHAKKLHGSPSGLTWKVRDFADSIDAGPFDVALCVGNSLALANDVDAMQSAFTNLFAAIRSGGAIVIHVLNVWRLPEGSIVWQKCLLREIRSRKVQILKGVHRFGRQGFVDLVVTDLVGENILHEESVPFRGAQADELATFAVAAGATRTEIFGGYAKHPYTPNTSTDLLLVAWK